MAAHKKYVVTHLPLNWLERQHFFKLLFLIDILLAWGNINYKGKKKNEMSRENYGKNPKGLPMLNRYCLYKEWYFDYLFSNIFSLIGTQ